MSILELTIVLSAGLWTGNGGDPVGPSEVADSSLDADSGIPLSLAEELPHQQGLDGAPVEKNPKQEAKQDDFGRAPRNDDGLNVSVGAHARFTVPFGAADHSYTYYYGGLYYVDHYLSWADFFNPGWGFDIEADFYLGGNGPGRRRTPGFNYALAFLYQTDQYYGTKSSDGFGNTLSLDDMTANSLQVGGRVVQQLANDFFYGGLIAIGAIHYSEVEGTFSGPFTTFRDSFFRDTWTIASTFRADGGYRLGAFAIVTGIGLRIMGPPSESTHVSLNSGAFWTFDIDLGVELGF
jgi:hypothetical protein